jgi:hypothetical protein
LSIRLNHGCPRHFILVRLGVGVLTQTYGRFTDTHIS